VETPTDDAPYAATIAGVVRRHTDSLRACYQTVLGPKPHATGKVVTRFAIDRLGKVRGSCVESSTLNEPLVETCVVDDILRWEFPAGPERLFSPWLIINFPFVFATQEEVDDDKRNGD
jgi:hypothetical protein